MKFEYGYTKSIYLCICAFWGLKYTPMWSYFRLSWGEPESACCSFASIAGVVPGLGSL